MDRAAKLRAGALVHLVEAHVPHQAVAPLGARVVHAVDSHVDHNRPGLDPVAAHHLRAPASRDHNVRLR